MKIIKHGKKPEPKILCFECPVCGCVFEETDDECQKVYDGDFDGNVRVTSWSVECPECEEWVTKYA